MSKLYIEFQPKISRWRNKIPFLIAPSIIIRSVLEKIVASSERGRDSRRKFDGYGSIYVTKRS